MQKNGNAGKKNGVDTPYPMGRVTKMRCSALKNAKKDRRRSACGLKTLGFNFFAIFHLLCNNVDNGAVREGKNAVSGEGCAVHKRYNAVFNGDAHIAHAHHCVL